jgi:hypothetical protein
VSTACAASGWRRFIETPRTSRGEPWPARAPVPAQARSSPHVRRLLPHRGHLRGGLNQSTQHMVAFQAEILEESRCRVDEETMPGD